MILQETVKNLDQEIKELLESPWFWISIIILLIFVHILITMALYPFLSNKIHNSYHKGYNKAKSDKVQYYKTIKKIIDKYDVVFESFREMEVNVQTILLMTELKDYLDKKYSN